MTYIIISSERINGLVYSSRDLIKNNNYGIGNGGPNDFMTFLNMDLDRLEWIMWYNMFS